MTNETKLTPLTDLQALSAYWYIFAKYLIAFARQISALEKTGARSAVHKAAAQLAMAQLALFEVSRLMGEVRALPESAERDALIARLEVTRFVLVALMLAAWIARLGRAARAEMFGAMAIQFTPKRLVRLPSRAGEVAAIDSS